MTSRAPAFKPEAKSGKFERMTQAFAQMTPKQAAAVIGPKLEALARISPDGMAAIDVATDHLLTRARAESAADRGTNNRLRSRLQAVHDCPKEDGGGFEQIAPKYGVKRWQCEGCGLIVTLEK